MRRLRDTVQFFYDTILRDHLPTKISLWNGVAVRGQVKLLDATDEYPAYEAALVESVRQRVRKDDNVVIVGGGKGVSTVVAAEIAGPNGSVTCFEGSDTQIEQVRQTVRLNRVAPQVTLRHSVVSDFSDFSTAMFGEERNATTTAPTELPDCDVLELDCEGAELSILAEMTISPEVIIVETHAFLDSPTSDVQALLEEQGYEITSKESEDIEKGVFVLTAVHSSSPRLSPTETSSRSETEPR